MSGYINALSNPLPDAIGVELGRYIIGASDEMLCRLIPANVAAVDMMIDVPLWLIVVLSAVAILGLGAMASNLSNKRGKPAPALATSASAQIFGITWRWTVRDGAICDLASYCPRCDQPVSPSEETRHGFLHLIAYRCNCSGWSSRSFQCSREGFNARVARAIQQDASGKGSAVDAHSSPV